MNEFDIVSLAAKSIIWEASDETCDNFACLQGTATDEIAEAVLATIRSSDSDFLADRLHSAFRRGSSNFSKHIESSSTFACNDSLRTLKENAKLGTTSQSVLNRFIDALVATSSVQYVGVRFGSLSLIKFLLPNIAKQQKFVGCADRLVKIATDRARDASDSVRRLAALDVLIATSHEVPMISDAMLCDAVCGLLSDPVRTNRIKTLNFLHQSLIKHSDESRLFHLLDNLKDALLRCCFDTDMVVLMSALRLVSDARIGEKLLGDDETSYQRLSNLVWAVQDRSDPFKISREALVFVNNHIFASPGILSVGDDTPKLAAVVEFVLQYSDGHVFSLCERFVGTLLSYFNKKRIDNHFLAEQQNYCTYIAWASSHYRIGGSEEQRMEISKKLSTVLEVLLSVIQCQGWRTIEESLASQLDEIRNTVACPEIARDSSNELGLTRCIALIIRQIRSRISRDGFATEESGTCLCRPVEGN